MMSADLKTLYSDLAPPYLTAGESLFEGVKV